MVFKKPGTCRSIGEAVNVFVKKSGEKNPQISSKIIYSLLDLNTRKKMRKDDIELFLYKQGYLTASDKKLNDNIEPSSSKQSERPIKKRKMARQLSSISVAEPQTSNSAEEPETASSVSSVASQDSEGSQAECSQSRKNRKLPTTGRALSRRTIKRREVFDPSDFKSSKLLAYKTSGENESGDESESSSISTKSEKPKVACHICKKAVRDTDGNQAKITCRDCKKVSVHGSCTKKTKDDWLCDSCLPCALCDTKGKGEPMVKCKLCTDLYHQHCGNVSKSKVKSDWLCPQCSATFVRPENDKPVEAPEQSVKLEDKPDEISVDEMSLPSLQRLSGRPNRRTSSMELMRTRTPSPTDLPEPSPSITETIKQAPDDDDEPPGEVPDCSEWTHEQVHSYFQMFVPSQDAQVFLDNEISGMKLKNLKRDYILSKLDLKLGAALKVFSVVKRLQTRSWDISLCWF